MDLQEAESLFNDPEKCIVEDIIWSRDPYHTSTFIFRETIYCHNLQMTIKGSFNSDLISTSFTILHPKKMRIYALNHGGTTHENDDGTKNGRLHKHRYRPEEPSWAYEPDDITANPDELEKLWKEFCDEAKIYHVGQFFLPDFESGLFDEN